MISNAFVQRMARYNRWQNASLYAAAETLCHAEQVRDRGAFFGSILGTLNHIYWADRVWMSRFDGGAAPETGITGSTALHGTLAALQAPRHDLDEEIEAWARRVDEAWMAGQLTWMSGAAGRKVTLPAWVCVTHFFNHQTHHRGQVHAMLTSAGAVPEATDLFLMPDHDEG